MYAIAFYGLPACRLAIVSIAVGLSAMSWRASADGRAPHSHTGQSEERSQTILASALNTVGEGAFRRISSLELRLRVQVFGGEGSSEKNVVVWMQKPSRVRIEECLVESWEKGGTGRAGPGRMPTARGGANPPGPISPMRQDEVCHFTHAEGYDPESGHWLKTARGVTDLAMNTPALSGEPFSPLAFLQAIAGSTATSLLEKAEIKGQSVLAVEVTLPSTILTGITNADTAIAGGRLTFYVHPESRLPIGVSYRVMRENGAGEVLELWSDHRRESLKLNGIEEWMRLPRVVEKFEGGKLILRVTIAKIKLNSKSNAHIFVRPK